MTRTGIWMKGPSHPGRWWYWLLGSGMVRSQEVCRCIGFYRPENKGKLQVCNNENGSGLVKHMARLWQQSIKRPKLPPKKMQQALERKFCGRS